MSNSNERQGPAAAHDEVIGPLGWTEGLARKFEPLSLRGFVPARVVAQHRGGYIVLSRYGEQTARVSGRLLHNSRDEGVMPAVGDWVAIAAPSGGATIINAVLPRTGKFSRGVAGERTEEQVVAANVDLAMVVSSLDGDFNLRRIERYLALAHAGAVEPVIVLSKADLADDIEDKRRAVESLAPGVAVEVISNVTGAGVEGVRARLTAGVTVVVLGSSGVGKSTLINRLLGTDTQKTREVRKDGKGRHVTTHRELFSLPGGAVIIDTPGMRELKLWEGDEELSETFADIDELAAQCRFRDCRHDSEPGCAIRAAIASGDLSGARFESYLKLQRESRSLEIRRDARAQSEERRKWRKVQRDYRAKTKFSGKKR